MTPITVLFRFIFISIQNEKCTIAQTILYIVVRQSKLRNFCTHFFSQIVLLPPYYMECLRWQKFRHVNLSINKSFVSTFESRIYNCQLQVCIFYIFKLKNVRLPLVNVYFVKKYIVYLYFNMFLSGIWQLTRDLLHLPN